MSFEKALHDPQQVCDVWAFIRDIAYAMQCLYMHVNAMQGSTRLSLTVAADSSQKRGNSTG